MAFWGEGRELSIASVSASGLNPSQKHFGISVLGKAIEAGICLRFLFKVPWLGLSVVEMPGPGAGATLGVQCHKLE